MRRRLLLHAPSRVLQAQFDAECSWHGNACASHPCECVERDEAERTEIAKPVNYIAPSADVHIVFRAASDGHPWLREGSSDPVL